MKPPQTSHPNDDDDDDDKEEEDKCEINEAVINCILWKCMQASL